MGHILAVSSADAQPPRQIAEEIFNEAVELFSDAQYEAALGRFKMSYDTLARPSTLFNIGMCHRSLFQNKSAFDAFNKLLSLFPEETKAEMKQEARQMLDELLPLLGMLVLTGDPPDGAKLQLNKGAELTLPLNSPLFLNPGSYEVIVRHSEFVSLKSTIEIFPSGKTELWAHLEKKTELSGPDITPILGNIHDSNSSREFQIPPSSMSPVLHSRLKNNGMALWVVGTGTIMAAVGVFFNFRYLKYRKIATGALEIRNSYESGQVSEDKYIEAFADYRDATPKADSAKSTLLVCYFTSTILIGSSLFLYSLLRKKRQSRGGGKI